MNSKMILAAALLAAGLSFGSLVGCSGDSSPAAAGPEKINTRFKFGDEQSFAIPGGRATPVDFQEVDLKLTFDPRFASATGEARVRLQAREEGYPYLFLDPAVSVQIGGREIETERRADPDGQNNVLLVKERLKAGEVAELVFKYKLDASQVTFRTNGIGFVSSMSDLDPGHYFEQYGPANYESDSFPMRVTLAVLGEVAPHRLFANGKIESEAPGLWQIQFPDHYTSSSFFFHLTDRTDLTVREFTVTGLEKQIPVQVYGASESLVTSAVLKLPAYFKELEADFGPYAHDSFIAYISSGSGGMEYVGSTITSVGALGHELTHSWFARGVMPADGRSGWIDEGIASWRDNGYFRAKALASRPPANLANLSPFERFTPRNCYKDGRLFFSELDLALAELGGAKEFLKKFFAERKRRTVTTGDLQAFLEGRTGKDLASMFGTYIFGDYAVPSTVAPSEAPNDSLHPTPLTEAEVRSLR